MKRDRCDPIYVEKITKCCCGHDTLEVCFLVKRRRVFCFLSDRFILVDNNEWVMCDLYKI